MTIALATSIVRLVGPCRIVIDRLRNASLATELGLMGCAVADIAHDGRPYSGPASDSLPEVGVIDWNIAQQFRSDRNMDRLIILPSQRHRREIEEQLFAEGWERHPCDMTEHDYPSRGNAALGLSLFRRADAASPDFPFRSSDVAADAVIARYAMAAGKARPGDSIFVDGAAASAGAEILAALSRAGAVSYGVDLAEAAADRFDLIVAFDPATAGWRARLDLYAGRLKPDGRIVVGWRCRDGVSAPADWHDFHAALCDRFLVETRYQHIVPGADTDAARALHPVPVGASLIGDWLIAVASANPLEDDRPAGDYRHPAFDRRGAPLPALVDFGAAYDNPYLYRTMVQMGERLGDDAKLARLAEIVSQDSAPASADRGAAVTVLGYRVLELRLAASVAAMLGLIEQYRLATDGENANPHVARWRLSQAFLAARLCELAQDRAQAIRWFDRAANGAWQIFSPLLATKAVAASFHEGRLHLAGNDMPAARRCFRRGLEISLEALSFSHGDLLGGHDRPIPFYMQELAEVADMGSQCANALANVDLWERNPGLFWRQVDMRRFGLASWARDLERENDRLRLSIGQ